VSFGILLLEGKTLYYGSWFNNFNFFRAVFLSSLALIKHKQDMDRIRFTEIYFGLIGWKKPAKTEAQKNPGFKLKIKLNVNLAFFNAAHIKLHFLLHHAVEN
jgi:hypothetical protein